MAPATLWLPISVVLGWLEEKWPGIAKLHWEMTPDQRRVHDLIVAGRRGRFGGPFQLLIRAPEICEHAAKLDGQTERRAFGHAHAPLAEKAGVPAAAIEAIRRGDTPSFELKDEALVYRVCTDLFKTRRLSDTTFNEAVTTLGETGLTEVIAIIGYYTLIGNILNVFRVAVPEGTTPPFPE